MAGTIFNDPQKGYGLVDTAGPNPYTGGNLARLRLSNKQGIVVLNIQSFAPAITGSNFEAAATTAKLNGADVTDCVAQFGYENGVGTWSVEKDGVIISAGTAQGNVISVSAGPTS